ncbi:flagellar biosynthetic protein FliR [Aureimonas jatrophae]|uniref:Flagellar biosynthetic protein FliR n=1 Tax=Aureimonas jatrophae TaxID=1166073 RepID=A0A1H0JH88_9HYPH|nr:flagellar biosynthetic protein FliR [Aureimonas jatrophae]MBB3951420.1 flagellar biosynthetic protein FliR [Aureimonas jatrophae]SDO42880.1 flagellar biosynthetic protein FliR [Aureimonas jatrophae]
MTAETQATIIAAFLIFCRVGACLMLLPGYASVRIPAQVRLFIAIALSLAISPGLMPAIRPMVAGATDDMRIAMAMGELATGLLIGLLGRVFMAALQFAGSLVANAIGMGQTLGVPIEDHEAVPALVTLVTMTATVLIFSLNLHAEIVKALVASYGAMPVERGFGIRAALASLVDNLDETFRLCLRISSPFVVYAVVVNFAIGLANKMTPQLPVYFISLPFTLAGGLVLLGFSVREFLTIFVEAYRTWVLFG